MSIQYAGGTNVDTTYTADGTQQGLISALEDALNTAGWTTVSGHHSSAIVLASAATPNSNSIRIRLKTTGNNCATVELLNTAASLISQIHFLLPTNGAIFRIVACQYQAFVFVPGSVSYRYCVCFGVPYVPSVISGEVAGECGWIMGDASTDTGSQANTFRTCLGAIRYARAAVIMNGSLLNLSHNNSYVQADIQLSVPYGVAAPIGGTTYAESLTIWAGGAMVVSDPLIGFGIINTSDPAYIRGQLWDAAVLGQSMVSDGTVSLDSHTFRIITINQGTGMNGTLVVRSSS